MVRAEVSGGEESIEVSVVTSGDVDPSRLMMFDVRMSMAQRTALVLRARMSLSLVARMDGRV